MPRPLPGPRRMIDAYGHLIIDGGTYMGRVRVPPLPPRIALTDRTTDDIRVLSHDEGAGSLDLVEVSARWSDVAYYGKHGGPYSNGWRLYLDEGVLAFEFAEGLSGARILTRRAFDTTVIEITPDTDGSVVYTTVDL